MKPRAEGKSGRIERGESGGRSRVSPVSLEEVERERRKFRRDEIRENAPLLSVSPFPIPNYDPPITISHPSTALYSVDEICFPHERYSKTRKTVRESGIKTT